LLAELGRKPSAQGVPRAAREEIVSDAMTTVVMDAKPIRNEQHLLGSFWQAVDLRLRRYYEGRHLTRLGGRNPKKKQRKEETKRTERRRE
jgi:hypothetical protein